MAVEKGYGVQVCDATGDAMKYYCPVHKKNPAKNNKVLKRFTLNKQLKNQ
jgi:hypothetical protein